MGTLSCQRCFAKADGATQKEADDLIDHGRGKMIGRPCSGNDSDLKWDDISEQAPDTTSETETTKSSTKITKKPKKG